MTGPGWSVAAADCLSPAGEKQPAADLFFGGIWLRTIPGILYYLAGEDGFIYGTRQRGPGSLPRDPLRLTGVINQDGYRHHTLMIDGKRRTFKAHTLILLAWVGPCPDGMEARHGPGGKLDNRPCNLQWGTHQQNIDDNRPQGKLRIGELNGAAKLTVEAVARMRARLAEVPRPMLRVVAAEFGVSVGCVSGVLYGKNWRQESGGERLADSQSGRSS